MKPRTSILLIVTTIAVLFTLITTSQATSFQAPDGQLATAQPLAGPNSIFLPMLKNGNKVVTPVVTPSNTPVITPFNTPIVTPGDEWTQHAHDAQHTSYTTNSVSTPWRWKWSWNGPNAQGGVMAGKFRLPRNVQPVTGGGRVYIAAGVQGVYAVNAANGGQLWNLNPGGEINSTPAYDPQSDSLFVVSSNGRLYRLSAASGQTNGEYNGQSTSTLPLPPMIYADRVYFSMGNRVFAINKANMNLAWAYNAASPVQTPPAFSPAAGLVVAASEDLYVHAINNGSGAQAWRVKPTALSPGDPGDNAPNAEVKYGWPVIAEVHGLVLIKLRLNWQTLWTWNPWPTSNAQMRANLAGRPDQQALYALRLSDGAKAFSTNIGHGGFGDGGRMPMGPQPVVKRFNDGSEVAYMVMRGSGCINSPCDGRYDSHLGEMVLDSSTVSGYQAGDVRFMQNSFFPTDEQLNLSMANNDIFGGHWMFGIAHRILDRSAARGATSGTPITVSNLPHIITSTHSCAFSASHYCAGTMLQDGDPRSLPAGFYIYYNQGTVYSQFWRGYSIWIVSGTSVYFLSNDGALIALENGSPTQNISAGKNPALQPKSPPVLNQTIHYSQAREFAGSSAVVEGQIKYVFNNGKTLLLGFENPHEGAFKVQIPKEYRQNFNYSPESMYLVGQQIRVRGLIVWYQGDPVIFVHSPEQIEIMPGQ